MKYIDADKLIAEIERQMNECIGRFGVIHKLPEYRCLKNIHSYIESLQQEQSEVDLEKDIEKICDFNKAQTTVTLTKGGLRAAAYHFYGLGLKARSK